MRTPYQSCMLRLWYAVRIPMQCIINKLLSRVFFEYCPCEFPCKVILFYRCIHFFCISKHHSFVLLFRFVRTYQIIVQSTRTIASHTFLWIPSPMCSMAIHKATLFFPCRRTSGIQFRVLIWSIRFCTQSIVCLIYRVFFMTMVFDHSHFRAINCIFGHLLRGFYYLYVHSCEPNSFSMASFFLP